MGGRGRVAARATAALALMAATGCKLAETATGVQPTQIAVHAVLNPLWPDYTVEVEQVLTGRVDIPDTLHFDPDDPIVSSGGVPVSGAEVWIYSSDGSAGRGVEDITTRTDGKGAGVYRFQNRPPPLFPPPGDDIRRYRPIYRGQSFQLQVTALGHIVTGETTIPNPLPATTYQSPAPFDRDTDTLRLAWQAAKDPAHYVFQITSPFGLFTFFPDSLGVAVPGLLQNPFAPGIPHVFVPGFIQTISIAAVDRNYYDWFRTRADPLTGQGRISHLTGGTGVFGSYVQMIYKPLDVTATVDEPVDGRWNRSSGIGGPPWLQLWVDQHIQGVALLTGNYPDSFGTSHMGIVGHLAGSTVSLALLAAQSALDTSSVLRGTVRGDSLVFGSSGSTTVYVKAP